MPLGGNFFYAKTDAISYELSKYSTSYLKWDMEENDITDIMIQTVYFSQIYMDVIT